MRAMNYLVGALLVLSALLAGWALVLAVDNPDIDGTSRGDDYTCLAPWDTVLNDADNHAGGEPPPDDDEIAARCRDAGEDRFGLAVGVGIAAVVVAALAGVAGVVRYRYDNRLST